MEDKKFNKLYNQYYLDVFRYAYSYIKRHDIAENILQDTFLELYLNCPKKEDNIKSWLMKVCLNKCHDYYNKEKNIVTLNDDYDIGIENKYDDNQDLILMALDKIPKKYSLIIRLFYYGNLSIKKISKLCFLLENTVKKRLQRGKELLKKVLEENYEY